MYLKIRHITRINVCGIQKNKVPNKNRKYCNTICRKFNNLILINGMDSF